MVRKLISSCVHAGKAMLTEESTASSRSTLCKAAKLSQQFLVMSAGVYVNLCSQLCFSWLEFDIRRLHVLAMRKLQELL